MSFVFFLFLTETMFDQKSSVFSSETMFSIGKFDEHFAGFIVNGEIKIVVEFLEIIDKLVLSKESNPPFKKTKLNNDGEVSKDLIREVPVIMESIVVNGFHVLPSQVEFLKRIFEKHPDVAKEFRPTNRIVKTAYMNVLLSLIETLRQSPREISMNDLVGACGLLRSMKEAGFQLDWLEKKLNEVLEKKEKEEAYETRMREIQEEMKDLKAKVLDVGAPLRQLPKEMFHEAQEQPSVNPIFQGIWSLYTAPNIKVFLWKAVKGAVAVEDRLRTRGILIEDGCSMCPEENETINHILFQCPLARQVWALSLLQSPFSGFGNSSFTNMNHVLHNCDGSVSHSIVHKAYEDCNHWLSAQDPNSQTEETKKGMKWIPPPQNELKCNIGVAWSRKTQLAGVSWVVRDDTGKVLLHSRRSYSQLLVFFSSLNNMADELWDEIQNLELGQEDPALFIPHEAYVMVEATNRLSLIARPLNPKVQNLNSVVVALPRSWRLTTQVHGRVLDATYVQFLFVNEIDLMRVQRRELWLFNNWFVAATRWEVALAHNFVTTIDLWVQIRGIPLPYISEETVLEIAQDLGEIISLDFHEATSPQIAYIRVRVCFGITDRLKFFRESSLILVKLQPSDSNMNVSGGFVAVVSVPMTPPPRVDPPQVNQNEFEVAYPQLATATNANNTYVGESSTSRQDLSSGSNNFQPRRTTHFTDHRRCFEVGQSSRRNQDRESRRDTDRVRTHPHFDHVQRQLPKEMFHEAQEQPSVNPIFQGIWSLYTAPNIKVFLWKAVKGAVAVEDRLRTRGILIEDGCSMCPEENETINHILFQCPLARQVWALSLLQSPFSGFGNSSFTNMNHVLHNCDGSVSHSIVHKAYEDCNHWLSAQDPNSQTEETKKGMKWIPPPQNELKCNIGVAWSRKTQLAGVSWVVRDDTGKVLLHSRRSYSQLLVFFSSLNNMADELWDEIQNLELGQEDPALFIPHEAYVMVEATNRLSLIARPLNPKVQNLNSVVVALPRSWRLTTQVHGRVLDATYVQFLFVNEIDLMRVQRRELWLFNNWFVAATRWEVALAHNFVTTIDLWVQIRGIPLPYISEETVLEIAQDLGEIISLDFHEATSPQIAYIRVRVCFGITDRLKFFRESSLILVKLQPSDSNMNVSGGFVAVVSVPMTPPPRVDPPQVNQNEFEVAYPQLATATNANNTYVGESSISR
ncbi:hypothetical protein ISN45_At03g031700 [Arabidopsis thaliana x Arabidopsis arenosa]|uniref:Reverse transcriptase zinc-binding domain-containing protein n=1 Tax=Arabidopsis thaliana x Arabidopsis arenosa TaxID=1240361 RepID=A0A8T2EUA1_9BRAS|nr:hypothetical protein ISN45_At03g031700 [Arabidopsis thaliana x Arabidopsis arenosa]